MTPRSRKPPFASRLLTGATGEGKPWSSQKEGSWSCRKRISALEVEGTEHSAMDARVMRFREEQLRRLEGWRTRVDHYIRITIQERSLFLFSHPHV